VQINSGSALIDAVGQHAGTLKLAANSANSATLNVTGGWIDVAQNVIVGAAGTGQVSQSGGIVHAAASVSIGASSLYTLSGGSLATPLITRTGDGSLALTGGVLHADRVAFSLINQGATLAPGSDAALQTIALAGLPDATGFTPPVVGNIGNTTINGDLTLQSGTLQIELASPVSFDTLTVDGTWSLGSALSVQLLAGYQPSPGDEWKIGTASTLSGEFASITPGFDVQISGGSLFLVAVPEPGSLAVLALVWAMRRRQREVRRR
jgi:hypothetical protein